MYNHTGLQGRLTADPELRYTQQGTAITSFTLASDTGRKTKDGKKITNFIECVAWRAQAEFVCKYLSKGRLVLVEGELTSRSYEDKDGNKRTVSECIADEVKFLGAPPQRDDSPEDDYPPYN
jgi:single-strand DNA-binding protein